MRGLGRSQIVRRHSDMGLVTRGGQRSGQGANTGILMGSPDMGLVTRGCQRRGQGANEAASRMWSSARQRSRDTRHIGHVTRDTRHTASSHRPGERDSRHIRYCGTSPVQ